MIVNRINFTTLVVSELARSRAYYEALGWVPEAITEKIVFYDMRGSKFALATRDLIEGEVGEIGVGAGAMTLAQNFPDEAGVDAAYDAALAAGARSLARPVKRDWGGYSGYVSDPDGHIWEFAWNPFSPLDDDGWIA